MKIWQAKICSTNYTLSLFHFYMCLYAHIHAQPWKASREGWLMATKNDKCWKEIEHLNFVVLWQNILTEKLNFKIHAFTLKYKTDKSERIVLICCCSKKIKNKQTKSTLIIDYINDLTDIFWTDGELHNRTADRIVKKNETPV